MVVGSFARQRGAGAAEPSERAGMARRLFIYCYLSADSVGRSAGRRLRFRSVIQDGSGTAAEDTQVSGTRFDHRFCGTASNKSVWRSARMDDAEKRLVYIPFI